MDLAVRIGSLRLEKPFMNASGILGVATSSFAKLVEAGVGAVVSKSIGPVPRAGNPNPSIVELAPGTLLNAVGLGNPGVDVFVEELPAIKACGVPVVASIFGASIDGYARVAERVERAGADAVELNVSCPHAEVSTIGTDPARTREVVAAVRDRLAGPLWVKLSPNVTDLVAIGRAAEAAGADAVVAINTLRAMSINVELQRPVLAHGTGGLSGSAIKPVAVRAVYELARALTIPVIGCGGVAMWADAVEFFLAGARAIQVGSALWEGYGVFEALARGTREYLARHGFAKLEDIVGLAARKFDLGAAQVGGDPTA